MSIVKTEDITYQCPRCKRKWHGSPLLHSIMCICHKDCDNCGEEQTCTTAVTVSGRGFKHDDAATTLHPSKISENYGPCSNCGYYNNKPPIYAVPIDKGKEKFDEV